MKNFRLMFFMSMLSMFIFSCSNAPNTALAPSSAVSCVAFIQPEELSMTTDLRDDFNVQNTSEAQADQAVVSKVNVNTADLSSYRRDKSINYFALRKESATVDNRFQNNYRNDIISGFG